MYLNRIEKRFDSSASDALLAETAGRRASAGNPILVPWPTFGTESNLYRL